MDGWTSDDDADGWVTEHLTTTDVMMDGRMGVTDDERDGDDG